MTDPARLGPLVEVRVAAVVGAHRLVRDGDLRGHQLDQPGDGGRRHALPPRFARTRSDPERLDLVDDHRLGDELLDDPASQVRTTVVWWHVPTAWSSAEIGDPLLEARERDLASPDGGDDDRGDDRIGDGHAGDQPLTPPTVIPSMKKRCATRKMMTTGRTMSVDAAISRLYETSCSLVKKINPTASGYLSFD